MPTEPVSPKGMTSPSGAVILVNPMAVQPAPTQAVWLAGSRSNEVRSRRSRTMPPSVEPYPAAL